MKSLSLPKNQRLCSQRAIDQLFSQGNSTIAYPLRAVFRFDAESSELPPARFMITVPKKKIRHAVGRVLMRRRIREAYRLNRHLLFPALDEAHTRADIALVYLSSDLADYQTIEKCIHTILDHIAIKVKEL